MNAAVLETSLHEPFHTLENCATKAKKEERTKSGACCSMNLRKRRGSAAHNRKTYVETVC